MHSKGNVQYGEDREDDLGKWVWVRWPINSVRTPSLPRPLISREQDGQQRKDSDDNDVRLTFRDLELNGQRVDDSDDDVSTLRELNDDDNCSFAFDCEFDCIPSQKYLDSQRRREYTKVKPDEFSIFNFPPGGFRVDQFSSIPPPPPYCQEPSDDVETNSYEYDADEALKAILPQVEDESLLLSGSRTSFCSSQTHFVKDPAVQFKRKRKSPPLARVVDDSHCQGAVKTEVARVCVQGPSGISSPSSTLIMGSGGKSLGHLLGITLSPQERLTLRRFDPPSAAAGAVQGPCPSGISSPSTSSSSTLSMGSGGKSLAHLLGITLSPQERLTLRRFDPPSAAAGAVQGPCSGGKSLAHLLGITMSPQERLRRSTY